METFWMKVIPHGFRHCGVFAIFYCDASHFQVEAYQPQGMNVASFQLAVGGRIWFFIGCSLAPGKNSAIDSTILAIGQPPSRRSALLMDGDFNTHLDAL